MTEASRCSNGSLGCNFDSSITLVEEVMQVLGRHNGDQRCACPMCLCASMLAVAALLHLESSTLGAGNIADVADFLSDTFASAARAKLRAVIDASQHVGRPGVGLRN